MNHKTDPLNKSTVCGKDALVYGMLGEKAAIWNYVKTFVWRGDCKRKLCILFDKLEPFLEGLEDG